MTYMSSDILPPICADVDTRAPSNCDVLRETNINANDELGGRAVADEAFPRHRWDEVDVEVDVDGKRFRTVLTCISPYDDLGMDSLVGVSSSKVRTSGPNRALGQKFGRMRKFLETGCIEPSQRSPAGKFSASVCAI